MQREKKTQPLPRAPVRGGSSPKCGPHRKTRGAAPAPQNPGLFPHRRGHSSHLSITCRIIPHGTAVQPAGCRIETQSRLRRGRGVCWEALLRTASAASSPAFHFGDTVGLCSWEAVAHDFGLPTVDRFPQFSAIAKKRLFICIQVMPKTAEIDQGWPSFRASLTRSRSFVYLRQSTKHTWSLELLPQAKNHRRATAG